MLITDDIDVSVNIKDMIESITDNNNRGEC